MAEVLAPTTESVVLTFSVRFKRRNEVFLHLFNGDEQRLTMLCIGDLLLATLRCHILHINAVTFGDFLDSSLKFDVLKLHDKLDCISSTVAAEAVPQVFAWRHIERRRFLAVEGAAAHIVCALPLQFDVFAENIDRREVFDPLHSVVANHISRSLCQQSMIDCPE